jgi:hypothetical protein
MDKWKLIRFERLSFTSNKDNLNNGQIPQQIKYIYYWVNLITGEWKVTTDIGSKKYKRFNMLNEFLSKYDKKLKKKEVRVFGFVYDEVGNNTISKFINMLSRKLMRKNISKLGHIWVRDVGDRIAKKHFHILIATSIISPAMYNELFSKKKHADYDVEFINSIRDMKNYLTKKELYGAYRKRAFGRSREFK